jgi:hypothetical protein
MRIFGFRMLRRRFGSEERQLPGANNFYFQESDINVFNEGI